MLGWISLDTLYLNVKYPKTDVFRRWRPYGADVDARQLKRGIAVEDAVVKGGSCGYAISVWQGDARAFLTDQVDEIRGEGNGMGIWVQLGPKFLGVWGDRLTVGVGEFLEMLGVVGDWPARVTRLDVAVDLAGIEMKEQDVEDWRRGWVGRSKVSGARFNSRTASLETVYVGSRGSGVFLRVYDKVAEAAKEGDLLEWIKVWGGYVGPVTRVEWETKPSEGGFEGVAVFGAWGKRELVELVNYLMEWGRLCIPSESDSNNRRWNVSALWGQLECVLTEWRSGNLKLAVRTKQVGTEPSAGDMKFLAGTVSGGMARLGRDRPNLMGMLDGMEEFGWSLRRVQAAAEEKARVMRILGGRWPKSGGPADADGVPDAGPAEGPN